MERPLRVSAACATAFRARARGPSVTRAKGVAIDAEFLGHGGEPGGGALFAEREGRGEVARAAALQRGVGLAQEWLRQGEDGVRSDRKIARRTAGGQDANRADAHGGQQGERLILDHVGQGAHEQELAFIAFPAGPAPWTQGRHPRPG